jgi:DNA repair protein RadC
MKLERFGEFKVLTLRETVPPSALSNGDTPDLIADYYRKQIETDLRYTPEVETFHVVVLSTRRKIQGHFLVATGTLDTILVHPREVFRPAIIANAAALVLLHNHPSGDPTPSEADIKVTRDLIRAGQLVKIEVLDHLVVGRPDPNANFKGYCSLRECGYCYL